MTMKTLVLDVESTIHNESNPFAQSNKLACIGLFDGTNYNYVDVERSGSPYGDRIRMVQQLLNETELLVGHAIKFDIHWLRRYGITIPPHVRVWDTQIFEYLDSNQRWVMPSLDECCKRAGLVGKTDDLYGRYWSKGIDTLLIPVGELFDYNRGDCVGTWGLYQNQSGRLTDRLKPLFELACEDLLILEEMEFNGMRIDESETVELGRRTQQDYQQTIASLAEFDVHGCINWNSNDHLSVLLFGGRLPVRCRETVVKQYKAGPKSVERWGTAYKEYPQRIKPLEGTEREKEGFYLVNEGILRSLHATGPNKSLLDTILKANDLEKLLNTYLLGLPKLIAQFNWEAGVIHGSFNQCVTRTGRLSSSKPNQQNFAKSIKGLFKSRYL